MINNPLLLLGLFNSATNLAGNLLEGAAKAVGLIDGESELSQGDFTKFLDDSINIKNTAIPEEVAQIIDSPNAEKEITQFLTEKLSDTSLDLNTKSTIEKIISTEPSVESNNPQISDNITKLGISDDNSEITTNPAQTTLSGLTNKSLIKDTSPTDTPTQQIIAASTNPKIDKSNNTEKVIINEDVVLNKKSLNTQGEIIKVDKKFINPLARNLGVKEDERILGKDNLQNLVKGVNKEISFKNNEVLGLKTQNVGDQVKIVSASGKDINIADPKNIDAVKDLVNSSNNNQTINLKNEADQFARVDQFAKAANNFKAGNQQNYQVQDQNFRIANISKIDNGIELKLDPVALGKVQIRLDFNAEGKSSITIVAERAETLQMLRSDSSSIQEILKENGLKSDSNSLSFSMQQGNNGQNGQEQEFNFSNGRNIAFNIEQELNDNITEISASNLSGAYRDLTGVGMLDMVV